MYYRYAASLTKIKKFDNIKCTQARAGLGWWGE